MKSGKLAQVMSFESASAGTEDYKFEKSGGAMSERSVAPLHICLRPVATVH